MVDMLLVAVTSYLKGKCRNMYALDVPRPPPPHYTPFPNMHSQFHYLVVVRATSQANYRVFAAGTTHIFRSGEVVVPVNKVTPGSWTLASPQHLLPKHYCTVDTLRV